MKIIYESPPLAKIFEWDSKINSFVDSQRLRFIKSSFLKVSFVVETLKVFVLKRKLEMHFQVELVTITYLVSLDFNWVGMNIEQ